MDRKTFSDWLSQYTDAGACLSAFKNRVNFFRINALKVSKERFESFSKIRRTQVSHYPMGYRIDEPEHYEIGKSWEYFLGYIYPQSLPSQLISLVVDPKKGETVLDVAAAPGSKFSHMAMLMQNVGVLVGNDLKKEKISALYATINRLNILNSIVTIRDGCSLDWRERFDKVLLDAPCTALGSGEGAETRWNLGHSKKISAIQKKMLFSAYDALRKGGELIYSTCTYPKEENEEVITNLLENIPNAKLVEISIDIPHESGLSDFGKEFRKCYRIYPQHLQSEGFFIAKIKKGE